MLERRRFRPHSAGMRGRELLCESVGWSEVEASVLLLNPRLPALWREPILDLEFPGLPEHVWLTTSGTGGGCKLIALSRAALEASARAVNEHLGAGEGDRWINPLPLFHVGGLGIVVRAHLAGCSQVVFGPWNAGEFVRRAGECGATLSALVPAQVHDLVREGLRCPSLLRAVVVGGGVLEEALRVAAAELGWPLRPSYGLSEASSQVATAARGGESEDWLPLLGHVEARVEADGLLQLRGASLLTGWMIFGADGTARWEDPKSRGWFRTSDRGEVSGRRIRVLGRVDDLIKIRGELVDVATLQRALQARVGEGLVRLDIKPDARNGASIHLVAENSRAAAEARGAFDLFPPYAKPASLRVAAVPRTELGKILRH